MGYSTDFSGQLLFTKELTVDELTEVSKFLGQDCREHPEWNAVTGGRQMTWIDLELTEDNKGLRWDGSEKTYDLTEKVQMIINEMRKKYPDFGLKGELIAQGEDSDDRWLLVCDGDSATLRELTVVEPDVVNNWNKVVEIVNTVGRSTNDPMSFHLSVGEQVIELVNNNK